MIKELSKSLVAIYSVVVNFMFVMLCRILYRRSLEEDVCLVSALEGDCQVELLKPNETLTDLLGVDELDWADNEKTISYFNGRYQKGYLTPHHAVYYKHECVRFHEVFFKRIDSLVIPVLEKTHNCHFNLRQISIMRIDERQFDCNGSFLFHRDGHPTISYKLIIYLTDVTCIESGPTSVMKNSSRDFVPPFGAFSEKRELDESSYSRHAILGKAGTSILFNCNALHAGGRVAAGSRIIMVLNFQPTLFKSPAIESLSKLRHIGAIEFDLVPR